jgi:hypothetical protein
VHHGVQHQAEGINKDVALLTFDFLPTFMDMRVS